MTDIDTAALREVALAASRSPYDLGNGTGTPYALHLATFSPTAVLALLDEVDRLRATVARVERHADDLTRQAAEYGASDSPFVWALRPLMTALGEATPTALTPDTKETDR